MSTTQAVTFGSLHVRGAWVDPAARVSAELVVYTKTGQARIVELSEIELMQLNEQVAIALRQLQTHRVQRRRQHAIHCIANTCCQELA